MHTVSKLRHDMNAQLQTAFALFTQGDTALAQEQLTQVSQRLRVTSLHRYCENQMVEAVLQEKANVCNKEGISLEVSLSIPAQIQIEPMKLCSLFANALDIAIDACCKLPEELRTISCRGGLVQQYLTVCFQNPFRDEGRHPPRLTQKHQDLESAILQDVVQEYGGKLEFTTENGVFSLTIWTQAMGGGGTVSGDDL